MMKLTILATLSLGLAATTSPVAAVAQGLERLDDEDAPQAKIEPGQLPADASPEARALWNTLVDAMLGSSETRQPPLRSFDLRFNMLVQRKGSHEVDKARFLFRAPNWVSSELSKTNRLVRGPQGDFLIGADDVVELVGRDTAEDRRQLDDTVSIAHNFTALTDPSRLRLKTLELASMPTTLPPDLRELGGTLRWLEAESPDFRLYRTERSSRRRRGREEPVYRAVLGLDPRHGTPRLVVIAELLGRRGDPGSALLVQFDDFKDLDGYQVPHYVATRSLDPQSVPLAFGRRDELRLWLFDEGRLNPVLEPERFSPPE